MSRTKKWRVVKPGRTNTKGGFAFMTHSWKAVRDVWKCMECDAEVASDKVPPSQGCQIGLAKERNRVRGKR